MYGFPTPKPPAQDSATEFVVLGAGMPRTGTTSLRAALERLLGGPCYHMELFVESGDEHARFWEKVIHRQVRSKELREFITEKAR